MGDLSLKGIVRVYRKMVAGRRVDPSNFSVLGLGLEGAGGLRTASLRSNLEKWASWGPGTHFIEDCGAKRFSNYSGSGYTQIWTHIVVKVALDRPGISDATMANLRQDWTNGIRLVWTTNNTWGARHPGESTCKLSFEILFVNENANHLVRVLHCDPNVPTPDPCRANSGKWFDNTSGAVVAHEFGHLLGYKDEYIPHNPTECPPRSPVNTQSIMDDGHVSSDPRIALPSRFMQQFVKDIESEVVSLS